MDNSTINRKKKMETFIEQPFLAKLILFLILRKKILKYQKLISIISRRDQISKI